MDSIHEASDPVDAVRKAEGIFIGAPFVFPPHVNVIKMKKQHDTQTVETRIQNTLRDLMLNMSAPSVHGFIHTGP